jgi:thymidylate synthase
MWLTALSELQEAPKIKSRAGECREIVGWSARLTNTQGSFLSVSRRALSSAYAAAEFLWYMSGTNNLHMIQRYAPSYVEYSDDGTVAHGGYGLRLENQLYDIVDTLVNNPESRQAVVAIWRPHDLKHAIKVSTKDLPCTLTWQFFIRNSKLHMVTSMRSNDIWKGMPYDVFAFTCVQRIIAGTLGIEPGDYVHHVGSLHLYEKNADAARGCLEGNRLLHNWTEPDDVVSCLRAVRAEESAREGKHVFRTPSGAMTSDLLACCSSYLSGERHELRSSSLAQGLKL